jgi:hypothetical protein
MRVHEFTNHTGRPTGFYQSKGMALVDILVQLDQYTQKPGHNVCTQARPVDHFENTIARELPGATVWVFLGVAAAYSAIFICVWAYSFPTPIEQLLWRAASITIMGCLIAYWAVTQFAFATYPAIKRHISTPVVSRSRQRNPEQNTRHS